MGQLKSTLYARMEEVSFRAGAVVAGGVLTTAGVAITLAVVLGGHSGTVASASATRAAVPPAVPAALAPVSSSPSASSPSAAPRVSRTTSPATGAGAYQPPSAARAAATLHAAATPGRTAISRRPVLRAPRHAMWSGWRAWHRSPPWLRPWHPFRHHHRR